MKQYLQDELITEAEQYLSVKVVSVHIPKQGMDGSVFIIVDENGNEFAVKYSTSGLNDVLALELIERAKLSIPVPSLCGHFPFEDGEVVILEKIRFPLLESVDNSQMHTYLDSMMRNLRKIHLIRSPVAGLLVNPDTNKSWKDFMLSKYSGNHPWFQWEEVMRRKGVDRNLIESSISKIMKRIQNTEFITENYSLLHTDFNQRNLFVNPKTSDIAAIVDWGEAMFGDPLYDFARVRMFIWHFHLENNSLQNYYQFLSLNPQEKDHEDLYLVSQVLDYIASYSAYNNEFNVSRLYLHQNFLKKYEW